MDTFSVFPISCDNKRYIFNFNQFVTGLPYGAIINFNQFVTGLPYGAIVGESSSGTQLSQPSQQRRLRPHILASQQQLSHRLISFQKSRGYFIYYLHFTSSMYSMITFLTITVGRKYNFTMELTIVSYCSARERKSWTIQVSISDLKAPQSVR